MPSVQVRVLSVAPHGLDLCEALGLSLSAMKRKTKERNALSTEGCVLGCPDI